MKLPTYEESEEACDEGTETPLQRFIYDNEPGFEDYTWRKQLLAALIYASQQELRQPTKGN